MAKTKKGKKTHETSRRPTTDALISKTRLIFAQKTINDGSCKVAK